MSKVIVQECENYELPGLIEKINSGVALLGGWDSFVHPGMTVLLKVNLIGPKSSDTAAVTHCEFVRALARILMDRQCKVWIGDSSGGAIAGISPTVRSFAVSGLEKVAAGEGAEIKNFDREGVVETGRTDAAGDGMYLAKPVFDADLVINVPKLKTHMSGIYTGAVKNLFGCVPGLKKAAYHRMAPSPRDLGAVLADINESIKPGLHIMDGIIAMEGEGPTAGKVYPAHKILIGTDPLALDTVACRMINLNMEDLPIFDVSRERNLGEWRIDHIEVAGDYLTVPALTGFKIPRRFEASKRQNYGLLVKVIDFLKARPKVDRKLCKHCNTCVESCPVQAIDKETKMIDYDKCIECMCCHELCMYKAVQLEKTNIIVNVVTKMFRRH